AVRLSFDHVDVDAEEFLRLGEAGLDAHRRDDRDALEQLRAALAAYRGDALPDEPYEDWAEVLRSEISATYAGVLRAIAAHATAVGDHLTGSDAHRRLLDLDQYDEQAHLGLVEALRALGAR